MLTVKLICIGKLKESYLKEACAEYVKRLGAFSKPTVLELDEYKLPNDPSEAQIATCIEQEGKAILQKLDPKGYMIAMCIEGKKLDSVGFSKALERVALEGKSTVQLVIGGSYGLSDEVKRRADLRLSMSDMTFPHQLARVMLLEQLYRAFQISSNGKYHK